MEIKIVKDAPISKLRSGSSDLKNMLSVLFNEGDLKKDALYLDKERVFKNRPSAVTKSTLLSAINAIRSNCVRFTKEITSEHRISITKVNDEDGNFTGIYIRFKNINLGDN
tara:strand:- start:161 stop:493 length:333 start_codon:yes stop_codon:yes gene_type:complete